MLLGYKVSFLSATLYSGLEKIVRYQDLGHQKYEFYSVINPNLYVSRHFYLNSKITYFLVGSIKPTAIDSAELSSPFYSP